MPCLTFCNLLSRIWDKDLHLGYWFREFCCPASEFSIFRWGIEFAPCIRGFSSGSLIRQFGVCVFSSGSLVCWNLHPQASQADSGCATKRSR